MQIPPMSMTSALLASTTFFIGSLRGRHTCSHDADTSKSIITASNVSAGLKPHYGAVFLSFIVFHLESYILFPSRGYCS